MNHSNQLALPILFAILMLAGCGSSSNSSVTAKDTAIEKIVAYAEDGSNAAPTIQDYVDAGATGVTSDNLAELNTLVDSLAAEDVDTTEELDALTTQLGINIAPTVNAGDDKTVQVNQAVILIGSGTDSDGSIVSYEWQIGSTVLATTATFDYTPTAVGTGTLTLTVTDNDGDSASDTVDVVVSAAPVPNQAPTAEAGTDQTIEVNQTITLAGSGTDSDGSIASYEWKKGATVLATTATFDYIPTVAGTYTLTLTVTDNDGAIANDTITVLVTAVIITQDTTPPAVSILGSTFLTIIQGNTYVDLGATAVDNVDGSITVFTSGTIDTARVGSYTLTYVATDSAGNAATATRVIDVQALDIENPINTLDINTSINDIQDQGGFIYVLHDTSILKLSISDLSIVEDIQLQNVTSAEGIALDVDGNIYVADSGGNKVIKLLSQNGYLEDSSFSINNSGSGNGELITPRDVSISGQDEELKVFVLDSGNNRIQIFNYVGAYLDSFDGSSTSEGKLDNPLNMIGGPYLVITDTGNKIVREIAYDEITKSVTGSKIISLNNFGKVTFSTNGLLVPDFEKKNLLFIKNKTVELELPFKAENTIALSYSDNNEMVYSNNGRLDHVIRLKTTPEKTPTAMSKGFITAYLSNDTSSMLEVTNSSLISDLQQMDNKVKPAFSAIQSYNEVIYMNGLRATVFGKFNLNGSDHSLKFEFSWSNAKWILVKVL